MCVHACVCVCVCVCVCHGSIGTSGAIPVGMYISIIAVWLVVSIPLTFLGGYLALRVPIRENPTKTNQIPRHIPPPPLSAHPWLLFFAGACMWLVHWHERFAPSQKFF